MNHCQMHSNRDPELAKLCAALAAYTAGRPIVVIYVYIDALKYGPSQGRRLVVSNVNGKRTTEKR